MNADVISHEHMRRVYGNALGETQMGALGFRLEESGQTIHHDVQIERRVFYGHLSCLDLAQIEQVVDERAKLPR